MASFDDLSGKNILITGSSGGIGACMAEESSKNGANVGIHYCHNKQKAEKVRTRITSSGKRAEIFQADLTQPEASSQLIKLFLESFGSIDILINNAGAVYEYEHFSSLTAKACCDTFFLNAIAPFFLIREAFQYMEKNETGGRIINISSASVRYGSSSNGIHYSAAKAALESIALGFSKAGADKKILVNTIRCGTINTDMHSKISGYNHKKFLDRIQKVPLKRAGEPLDIASMALFLASNCGDFITGQIFTVSGGD
jgi:3-oxoacyl-[acyl-carrier protein] reductase